MRFFTGFRPQNIDYFPALPVKSLKAGNGHPGVADMTRDDKSARPEDIVPALFPALSGMTAHLGRARTNAVVSCASAPSGRGADASSSAAAQVIAADLTSNAGSPGRTPPADIRFRKHQRFPGCCAGRDGVASDPQRRPQGRSCNSGCAPRVLSPRKLVRSVHQPCRTECGRGRQRDPYIDRPSGQRSEPRPYAAPPVGCGLVRVPRRPLPAESRPGQRCSPARSRCAARPFPSSRVLLPARTTFREVIHV